MKKLFTTLGAFLLILTGCNGEDNHNSDYGNSSNNISDDISEGMINIDELDGYVANISDARSLGIGLKSNTNKKQLNSSSSDYENITTFVKSSIDEYTPNDPVIGENGLEEVTFTKTNTTITGKVIEGQKTYIATSSEINYVPVVLSYDDTSITIEALEGFEYRLIDDGENAVTNWTKKASGSDVNTIIFNGLNTTEGLHVDSRCVNAHISFNALDGFKYTLIDYNDKVIYKDVTDNSIYDINNELGIIEFNGLLENENYKVSYVGEGEETIVTQEQVNGIIDKLYTLDNFTFISYVLPNLPPAPNYDDSNPDLFYQSYYPDITQLCRNCSRPLKLKYDRNDGVAIWDKVLYFSSNNRQSYVINNSTGLIYKLDDFKIDMILNGLIYSDGAIYDLKENEDGTISFMLIFDNEFATVSCAFKDKYGNKFIGNDRIETYDSNTRTTFYLRDEWGVTDKYFLTSSQDVLKTDREGEEYFTGFYILDENLNEREINKFDNFNILRNTYQFNGHLIDPDRYESFFSQEAPRKIENGIVYISKTYKQHNFNVDCVQWNDNNSILVSKKIDNKWETIGFFQGGAIYDASYLEDYDCLLLAVENGNFYDIYSIKNTYQYLLDYWDDFANCSYNIEKQELLLSLSMKQNDTEKLLTDVNLYVIGDGNNPLGSAYTGVIVKYEIYGTRYYEIIGETDENGEFTLNAYEVGEYEEPIKEVVLQPLNR